MTKRSLVQDWSRNPGKPFIRIVLVLFRIANVLRTSKFGAVRLLGAPFAVFYRIVSFSGASIDVPPSTSIGRGLAVHHGIGLVIHRDASIGEFVTLRHGVTIGTKASGQRAPRIGDRVDIGAGAIILGDISVGHDAVVGAGSVVLRDVPPGAVVAGNPARVVGGRR